VSLPNQLSSTATPTIISQFTVALSGTIQNLLNRFYIRVVVDQNVKLMAGKGGIQKTFG